MQSLLHNQPTLVTGVAKLWTPLAADNRLTATIIDKQSTCLPDDLFSSLYILLAMRVIHCCNVQIYQSRYRYHTA